MKKFKSKERFNYHNFLNSIKKIGKEDIMTDDDESSNREECKDNMKEKNFVGSSNIGLVLNQVSDGEDIDLQSKIIKRSRN